MRRSFSLRASTRARSAALASSQGASRQVMPKAANSSREAGWWLGGVRSMPAVSTGGSCDGGRLVRRPFVSLERHALAHQVADLARDRPILGPCRPPKVFDQLYRHPQAQSTCLRHEFIMASGADGKDRCQASRQTCPDGVEPNPALGSHAARGVPLVPDFPPEGVAPLNGCGQHVPSTWFCPGRHACTRFYGAEWQQATSPGRPRG